MQIACKPANKKNLLAFVEKKKMRWQDVTISQLKRHGWDVTGNEPEEVLAPLKNAYAWGDISGDGLSVYCEHNAEAATAFNLTQDTAETIELMEGAGWTLIKLDNNNMCFEKDGDIADFSLGSPTHTAYLQTYKENEDDIRASGQTCLDHLDDDVEVPAWRRLLDFIKPQSIVSAINLWEGDRGANYNEWVADILNKDEFKLIVDMYGVETAVNLFNTQRETGAQFYLVGSNFDKPQLCHPRDIFNACGEDIAKSIKNNPEFCRDFFDIDKVLSSIAKLF